MNTVPYNSRRPSSRSIGPSRRIGEPEEIASLHPLVKISRNLLGILRNISAYLRGASESSSCRAAHQKGGDLRNPVGGDHEPVCPTLAVDRLARIELGQRRPGPDLCRLLSPIG